MAAVGTPAWGRPAGHVAVYVADPAEGTVTPILTATNSALKPIKVPAEDDNPSAMAITPAPRCSRR